MAISGSISSSTAREKTPFTQSEDAQENNGSLPPEGEPISVRFPGDASASWQFTATDTKEVFAFVDGQNVAVYDFDLEDDYLDFTQLPGGFSSYDDLLEASWNFTNIVTGEQTGILINLGDGQVTYIDGLSVDDLATADISI